MTDPDIKIINQTQGKNVRPPTDKQVGLPNGLTSDRLSSGGGSGGGFGSGRGSGAGNGLGTGEGNGNGSGSGNGNGNGNGNGKGDGNAGIPKPPPPPVAPPPVGPTEAIKILSKPQPRYTDAARQNNVTGTVTLKVTFTASGQIGSIAPVSGLPYGLTEQAIAAAKAIRFEPPKRNGVPYSVSKTISYSFTIY
ncbi:MAG: energy transducer TonB [Acidobacteriota bacterium]|nr:energy transducer TonB [Acidobacteriota bacterium]